MTTIIEVPLSSETLNNDEVSEISGCRRRSEQVAWLKRNGWIYFLNKAGMPIIGRLYARMKLSGINPANLAANDGGWTIDVTRVR